MLSKAGESVKIITNVFLWDHSYLSPPLCDFVILLMFSFPILITLPYHYPKALCQNFSELFSKY